MKYLWPRSLLGQLTYLLLLALVAAQVIGALILFDDHRMSLMSAKQGQVLGRIAAIVRVLAETPENLHERILKAASTRQLDFKITAQSTLDANEPSHLNNPISQRLVRLLDQPADRPVLVAFQVGDMWSWRERHKFMDEPHMRYLGRKNDDDGHLDDQSHRNHMKESRPVPSLSLSLQLTHNSWLNATYRIMTPDSGWAFATLMTLVFMALAVCIITFLVVRRITRPLAKLASAADALGRGDESSELQMTGPVEIRQTIHAFIKMRDRLRRFVDDRTRMLAAISHDLRSPLTSLRLRTEMLEDGETRQRMLESLKEMQRMTEATLAFASEDANKEETRTTDFVALVESMTLDMADLGQDVEFAIAKGSLGQMDQLTYRCRPFALKRAIRNVIENAVRYGKCARLELAVHNSSIHLTVKDDGPGIPIDKISSVFEPFVRLEESRSPETGGIGLGLAIARNIIRSLGGDITMTNRSEKGLCVLITLPLSDNK